MTRNTIDNAIVLDAMMGYDKEDASSRAQNWDPNWYKEIENNELKGKRFGALSNLMERDSIYKITVEHLSKLGADVVLIDPPNVELNGFSNILNLDMKDDLPGYLGKYTKGNNDVTVHSVADVIAFNKADSITRIPYGQARFDGILADTTSLEELENIKTTLEQDTRKYFNSVLDDNKLDAVLSINNYHAGYAAIAKYPALTVPMGYKTSGEPISLTFIAKQFQEVKLLQLGAAFEKATKVRAMPTSYK
jgi:amidase